MIPALDAASSVGLVARAGSAAVTGSRRTLTGMEGDVLVVFVKAPRPGQVKTRLAASLGAGPAADLYRRLAEDTLRGTVPREGEYARVVAYAPADALGEVAAWLPGATLEPQQGADLGQRMAHAFATAFERGARRVALIGSDVVGLERGRVLEAFAALQGHDLVLGPARDGGYYLIALATAEPRLFTGVAWSTPSVLAETLQRAAQLGLRVRLLGTLRDVDAPEDARAFLEEVGRGGR